MNKVNTPFIGRTVNIPTTLSEYVKGGSRSLFKVDIFTAPNISDIPHNMRVAGMIATTIVAGGRQKFWWLDADLDTWHPFDLCVNSLQIDNGPLIPYTDGYTNIGSASLRFKDGYFSDTVIVPTLSSVTTNVDTVNAGVINVDGAIFLNPAGLNKVSAQIGDGSFSHTIDLGSPSPTVWLHITPGDPSAYVDFYGTYNSTTNPTHNDNVFHLGHNIGAGGGAVIPGRGALSDAWESYYNGGHIQQERHLKWVDADGYETRFISFEGHIDDGSTNLFIDASVIRLGSGRNANTNPSVAVAPTITVISSPSQLRNVQLDDSGPGNITIANSDGYSVRSQLVLASNGQASLDTSYVGRIGDIRNLGNPSFQWDNGVSQVLSPDNKTYLAVGNDQVLFAVGPGNAPASYVLGLSTTTVSTNRLVFITHNDVVTETRGDTIAAIGIRNNTAATNIVTRQFSPSIVQTGYGWTGSANRAVSFETQVKPSGDGYGKFVWAYSNDEANYAEVASLGNDGQFTAPKLDIEMPNSTSFQAGTTGSGPYNIQYQTDLTQVNGAGLVIKSTSATTSPILNISTANSYGQMYMANTSGGGIGTWIFNVFSYETLYLSKGDNRAGSVITGGLSSDQSYNDASLLVRNRWDGAPGAVIAKRTSSTTSDIIQVTAENLTTKYFYVTADGYGTAGTSGATGTIAWDNLGNTLSTPNQNTTIILVDDTIQMHATKFTATLDINGFYITDPLPLESPHTVLITGNSIDRVIGPPAVNQDFGEFLIGATNAVSITIGGSSTTGGIMFSNVATIDAYGNFNADGYVHATWFDTVMGGQLTAAGTITPTSGLHHVTGATQIDIISTANIPSGTTVELTLIADGGTITLGTGGGTNIKVGGTIAIDTAQKLVWDGSFWYLVA